MTTTLTRPVARQILTFAVVGVTLWAPGAASFVKSSNDIKELSKPEPMPPPTTWAVPPQPHGP